jgi:uncharacterized protein HemX
MNEPRSPQPPPGSGPAVPRPAAPRSAAPRSQQGTRPAGGPGGNPSSSPRAEFIPEKKKGAPPALTIGLLAAVVVTAGVFGWAMLTNKERQADRPTIIDETDNNKAWNAIEKKMSVARDMFQDTMKLRTDESQRELFAKKLDETIAFISGVREEIDAMLESVRDPVTDQLPTEYLGYNHKAKDLVMMLSDLSKASPFGITPEGEK